MSLRAAMWSGGLGCLTLLAAPADGEYAGLGGELFADGVMIDGKAWDVWRVYANTTNPMDTVEVVSGNAANPIIVEAFGGGFYQNKTFGPNDTEPNSALFGMDPNLEFDTFVTIGAPTLQTEVGGDLGATQIQGLDSPGFLGSQLVVNNGAWFRVPGNSLTVAGDDLRVLIGQFTVPDGGAVGGIMRVGGRFDGESMQFFGQTFGLPAPGTLAMLTLAALGLGPRRRRIG